MSLKSQHLKFFPPRICSEVGCMSKGYCELHSIQTCFFSKVTASSWSFFLQTVSSWLHVEYVVRALLLNILLQSSCTCFGPLHQNTKWVPATFSWLCRRVAEFTIQHLCGMFLVSVTMILLSECCPLLWLLLLAVVASWFSVEEIQTQTMVAGLELLQTYTAMTMLLLFCRQWVQCADDRHQQHKEAKKTQACSNEHVTFTTCSTQSSWETLERISMVAVATSNMNR